MPVVEVSHLRKAYRGQAAVRDISFTIEQGEIFGILGPNGAGKTTTVECLAGMRKPDGGTIKVLGLEPRRDRAELRQRVGIQLQAAALPDKLKVWEALALYSSFYRQPADCELLLDGLGLAEKRDARFEQLSGGQKQRLSIALALAGSPELAILDELSTGLDPQPRRDVWELIRQIRGRGVTVVLVTHAMQEAEELCDRLPAQGRAARRAAAGGAGGGPGRGGAVAGGGAAADGPDAGARSRGPEPARARCAGADRQRRQQPRDRPEAVYQRGDGQNPPAAPLRQAGRARPGRRGRRGLPARPAGRLGPTPPPALRPPGPD